MQDIKVLVDSFMKMSHATTVDTYFEGEFADEAKGRAEKMSKITHFRI